MSAPPGPLINFGADNARQGNRAMASVLLLYYHLLLEGGITNDQTVYLDPDEFDPFDYVDVTVTAHEPDVSQRLLRQGAVIALLCELNDMVADYEADYLAQPFTHRVLQALSGQAVAEVPEVAEIVRAVTAGENVLDCAALNRMLRKVFETYVVREFDALATRHRR